MPRWKVVLARMEPSFEEMTIEERLRHLQALWDRIAENPAQVPVTGEQSAIIDERLAAYDRDPSRGEPWESVLARARLKR